MKVSLFFIFIPVGIFLSACNNNKNKGDMYSGKLDSASIGLTKKNEYKEDSILRADSSRPVMPIGMIIDTGANNPFADDSAYLAPQRAAPLDTRDRRQPATTEPIQY